MDNKANGVDVTDWARAPPSGPLWQRILKSIYNPEEKSFLGRTAKRWGIVIVFYLVFYAVLAVLFSLCMAGLFLTIDDNKPSYTLGKSLIGASPGVTSRPMPINGEKIYIEVDNNTNYDAYFYQIEEFLRPYNNVTWFKNQQQCVAEDAYGLPNTPCLYIKLNKIFDWNPDCYDDVGNLPSDMPEDLKEYINNLEPVKRKQVWVSCLVIQGNETEIEYPWGRGLPATQYPYRNQDGYLSPLVAVRVTPAANLTVDIRCRAWAKNIVYNKSIKEAAGYARVLLHIQQPYNDTITV